MASLEQVFDLNTTTFEKIIGHLKMYEEQVGDEEEAHKTTKNLCMKFRESVCLVEPKS